MKVIETDNMLMMVQICAELKRENVNFVSVWKNGRWVITLE
jgi:hypothetical protein